MSNAIDLTEWEPKKGQAEIEHKTAVDLLQEMRDLPVETQEDLEFAANALNEICSDLDRIKKMQDSVVKPIEGSLKILKSWFKPAIDTYSQCEKIMKAKIKQAYEASFEAQEEVLEKVSALSMAGDAEGAAQAMEEADAVELQPVKGVQLRHGWDFEITDFDKIPDQYKVVDESKVLAVIRAHKGKVTIPGIKAVRKTTVARGRR